MKKKVAKTVFVGVSGGVDSSVSAVILRDQGYNVVGVFIRTWTPDFIECTWRDERRDAMRVCAYLGIPFLECDAEDAYKKGVADYMIEEYKKGNTPNPDVMCNREVKFGVFWEFAREHGAEYIATGHYAQNSPRSDLGADNSKKQIPLGPTHGNYELQKSPDKLKDQSYFLWTLTQDDLAHTLFPIGHLEKSEVRKKAEKYGLPTATKKDSQGVCFLGPLDMKEFLKHYIEPNKGDVLDESGTIIGQHDGAAFFTLGERHGFTITKHTDKDVPLYVISKNVEKNTIIVSSEKHSVLKDTYNSVLGISSARPVGPAQVISKQNFSLQIKNTNWISEIPLKDKKYKAQIRYHGEEYNCTIEILGANEAKIQFVEPIMVSPGQSIVVYEHDLCIGGGIVK